MRKTTSIITPDGDEIQTLTTRIINSIEWVCELLEDIAEKIGRIEYWFDDNTDWD